jgi:hypothetical protein
MGDGWGDGGWDNGSDDGRNDFNRASVDKNHQNASHETEVNAAQDMRLPRSHTRTLHCAAFESLLDRA